jgi:EAL domain-containing protein (putative c-di-GMP-specific phosphodiesterase class I)
MTMHDFKDVQYLNQLRSAVKNNEMVLFYQPQIDTNTGELCGKEALIRWNHPEYGILTPIHFIELAEKSGLIMEIGEWVIKTAIQQQSVWRQAPFNDKTPVSVNISATQLYKSDFCEMVDRYAQANGLPHAQICFELTESMFMQDVEGAIKVMQKLKDKGYSVAIDDFGTGYSNLSYLKKFPIDLLKIDQVFVRNVHLDQVNAEIIKAIVAIGKAMSLDLVAEGVETDEELNLLQQFGCNNVQGYYYAKPLAVTDFNALQFEHA